MARKRTGPFLWAWSLLFLLVISLASVTFPAHAASSDLVAESIWLEDASQIGQPVSQVSPWQSFNIVATIKNIGQDTASGYYLDVYYDSDFGRGGPDNIAPGEVQSGMWAHSRLKLAHAHEVGSGSGRPDSRNGRNEQPERARIHSRISAVTRQLRLPVQHHPPRNYKYIDIIPQVNRQAHQHPILLNQPALR